MKLTLATWLKAAAEPIATPPVAATWPEKITAPACTMMRLPPTVTGPSKVTFPALVMVRLPATLTASPKTTVAACVIVRLPVRLTVPPTVTAAALATVKLRRGLVAPTEPAMLTSAVALSVRSSAAPPPVPSTLPASENRIGPAVDVTLIEPLIRMLSLTMTDVSVRFALKVVVSPEPMTVRALAVVGELKSMVLPSNTVLALGRLTVVLEPSPMVMGVRS